MMLLYRLFYFALAPFVLFFGLIFSSKIRRFLLNKDSNLKKQKEKTYWLHVSSGEFEHAKAVLRELKRKEPFTKTVVTYSSPSYINAIKSCPEVDYYTPYKLDLKAPVAHLIRTINPKAVLIARTDLWPELLDQLKRKKIPSVVFARHENAKNVFLKKISYSLTYKKVSHISFVSDEDVKNYKKITKLKSYSVDGDPRIEEVFYKKEQLNLENITPFKDSLILGSTWDEDIGRIRTPIIELLKENKLKKLIIAPHEPDVTSLDKLKSIFSDFSPSLYTEDKELDSRVIVIDEIGHLFKLYCHCEIAFVGGSFKKKVHSVLEPLSFGIPVLVGPFYHNNAEAKTFQRDGSVSVCTNTDEFYKRLEGLLNNRPSKEVVLKEIRQIDSPSKNIITLLEEFF